MSKQEAFAPAIVEAPLDRQRLFVRYFVGFLIDLVVLNLFAEYSEKVVIDTFTTSWSSLYSPLRVNNTTTWPGTLRRV